MSGLDEAPSVRGQAEVRARKAYFHSAFLPGSPSASRPPPSVLPQHQMPLTAQVGRALCRRSLDLDVGSV